MKIRVNRWETVVNVNDCTNDIRIKVNLANRLKFLFFGDKVIFQFERKKARYPGRWK